MADYTQVTKLLEQIRSQLSALEAELARLQAAEDTAPGERALRAAAPPPPPARDLPNVILPTQTDDPDSIVGGRPTSRRDFQDCCAVGSKLGYFCSGTLIAPNVVVTAKHCKNIDRVFLKGNDVRHPDQGETIKGRAVPHPDKLVDLQLLVLEEPSKVKPRRVAREDDVPHGGEPGEAMLVGFGTIDLGGSFGYGVKRQVEVPVVTYECTAPEEANKLGCRQGYEMVAGHRGLAKDSCRGDSGGPLYIKDSDGRYVLLGATSRGAQGAVNVCGDGGIYVRVDKFRDWIKMESGAEV